MNAEVMSRALHFAARRLRSARWDLEQILGPPGEFPKARRQTLESIDDNTAVAARLINDILDALR